MSTTHTDPVAHYTEQTAIIERRRAARRATDETLHTFLNAAAGEGLVLDGVDAADLYIAIFPERYAAALASIDTGVMEPRNG